MKEELLGLSLLEIEKKLEPMGMKKFRAKQIFQWIYEKSAASFDEMTNLSKEDIKKLKENFSILLGEIKLVKELKSSDNLTYKVLLQFPDGNSVETVCMHHDYGYSICISSQVGCQMGCAFCASGLFGKVRDLTCAEILAQIYYFQRYLMNSNGRVSRIVVMGSGEPMLNLDNTLKALDLVHTDYSLCISYRNMTVSTCGIIPGIERLIELGKTINLAISLHSAIEETRTKLMPINKKYNYLEVVEAAQKYADKSGRQVMYEYILLSGINDSLNDAKFLANLLKHKNAVVNLIPANPVAEKGFKRPSKFAIDKFYQVLKEARINVTVRREMGKDINAACGQLRASTLK